MHFRPSSRSSTRSAHNSFNSPTAINMNMNANGSGGGHHAANPNENDETSPLQSISSNRLFRNIQNMNSGNAMNAATNPLHVMRSIIDSPRRALLNRKKRHSSSANENRKQQQQQQQQQTPEDIEILIKSSSLSNQYHDENCISLSRIHGQHDHALSAHCQHLTNFHMNANMNIHTNMSLYWLEHHAPQDIIPKVLSFAGPQMIQILSRVNKSWNETCLSEAVFQTLCEETGKWIKGKHKEPDYSDACDDKDMSMFWRKQYTDNPIVPLDYRTIPDALAAVCTRKRHKDQTYYECDHSVRILLHPALYVMKKRIVVETLAEATFAVETHNHYRRDKFDGSNSVAPLVVSPNSRSRCNSDGSASTASSPPANAKRRLNGPGLREIFNCRNNRAGEDTSDEGSRRSRTRSGENFGVYSGRHATIILRTRMDNTPIFHIRQGQMRLSRMNLIHECTGVDIWNGNAAVQIQPRHEQRPNQNPTPIIPAAPHHSPSALVEDSKIMSVSGRGIVAIDGSAAHIRKCHIHKCAATGVYVGGAGSVAHVTHSDIVQNGIGNVRTGRRRPRGRIIARGHSGVYLEQGKATLTECNVSRNALTGISAVSPSNAILHVSDSDIVANGTLQIELPPAGTVSYRKASNVNNRISSDGQARIRSGFKLSDIEMEESGDSNSTSEEEMDQGSESEDW